MMMYKIKRKYDHYEVYINGKFYCSADNSSYFFVKQYNNLSYFFVRQSCRNEVVYAIPRVESKEV